MKYLFEERDIYKIVYKTIKVGHVQLEFFNTVTAYTYGNTCNIKSPVVKVSLSILAIK